MEMKLHIPKFNLVELSTPILMLLWAMWFFLFDFNHDAPVYDRMQIVSSYTWAFMFAVVASVKAYSVVYNNYKFRRLTAFASVWLWLAVMTFFAFGNYRSHLVPSSLFFAYQSFLSWHRMRAQKNK
jgi:hypothetical protein